MANKINVKKRFIEGTSWMGILQFSSRGLDFIRIIILARILTQSDFGLFAIVTSIINLLEAISETGLEYAIIHFQEELHPYAKTILSINFVRGVCLTLINIVIAKFLASFFNNPVLFNLLLIASFIPLINSIQNPYLLYFYKKFQFKNEFLYQFISSFITAFFTILLALIYRNALSLVFGLLIGTIFQTLLSYVVIKSDFSHPISFSLVKKLLGFSKWLTIGGISSYLMTQIDNLFIGKFFNTGVLGIYDMSFKIGNIAFSEITDNISKIAFPIYAHIQNDKLLMKNSLKQHILFISIPTIILSFIFIAFPKEIIVVVLGNKWLNAAPILQILAVYGCFRSLMGPFAPFLLALGKPKVLTITDSINFLLLIILLFPFSKLFNLNGVAYAVLISYIISQTYTLYITYTIFRSNA